MAKARGNPDAPYWKMLAQAEKDILLWLLEETETLEEAANLGGISRSHFHQRLVKYGIINTRVRRQQKTKRKAAVGKARRDSHARSLPAHQADPPSETD